jgi:tRNA (cytidine/uridine-2'-O-)-methyltransferase
MPRPPAFDPAPLRPRGHVDDPVLHVVLVEPLIPPNTGNTGRLCVAVGARLHLVEPLGFSIDSKAVRRAGLDYWKDLDLRIWPDWEACRGGIGVPQERFFYLSARAARAHTAVRFQRGDVLVFGKETTGLGPEILGEAGPRALRVPFWGPVRSLNLSTTVGVVVYEALRQALPQKFPSAAATAPPGETP